MKYLLITCLIQLSSFALWGQSNHLSGLHGLKNDQGDIFLEIAGYDIAIYTEKGNIDNPQTMASIKKSFGMDDILVEGSNPSISKKNKVLEATTKPYNLSDVEIYQICSCLQETKDIITIIYFETLNYRDVSLEKEVITAYFENKLSPYISSNWKTTSVDFAGQLITFDHYVEWVKPHELTYETSQIKWSEFSSLENAQSNINRQIAFDKADRADILSEVNSPVIINGNTYTIHQIAYNDLSSSPSKVFIVYYTALERNQRYVSYVLSHYVTDNDDLSIPQFLLDFISGNNPDIKKKITNSQSQQENNESEKSVENQQPYQKLNHRSEKQTNNDLQNQKKSNLPKLYATEFRAGVWLPVGDWDYFGESFSWSVFGGLPIKRKSMIDLGLNIIYTDNSFLFHYVDNKEMVSQVELISSILLRYRYHHQISKNALIIPYIGGEWSFMESKVDFKDQAKIFGGFAGITYRYKRLGLFVEYHYTPYKMSGKIRQNYHSSIQLGASLSFFSY